jgi:hypothetical protein
MENQTDSKKFILDINSFSPGLKGLISDLKTIADNIDEHSSSLGNLEDRMSILMRFYAGSANIYVHELNGKKEYLYIGKRKSLGEWISEKEAEKYLEEARDFEYWKRNVDDLASWNVIE